MRFSRIELENWMAFEGTHSLELPSGPIAVVARYANNPRRSNWAGKTAFIEAFDWCLHGVHRKRLDDAVITWGQSHTLVRLTTDTGVVIQRRLERGGGKSAKIQVVDVDGTVYKQKTATHRIEELIGMSHAERRDTLCFAQGSTEGIVAKTSAKRREDVSKWFDLVPWTRVFARSRARYNEIAEELKTARSSLDEWEAAIGDIDISTVSEQIASNQSEVAKLKKRVSEIDDALEAASAAQLRAMDIERLEQLTRRKPELKKRVAAERVKQEDIDTAEAKHSDAETRLRNLEDEIAEVRKLATGSFDGVCPVTCEDCPVADDVRSNTAASRARLRALRDRRSTVSKEETETRRATSELRKKQRSWERIRDEYNDLIRETKQLRAAIDGRDTGNGSNLTDGDIEKLRDEKRGTNEYISEIVEDIGSLRAKEASCTDAIARAEALTKTVGDLEHRSQVSRIAMRCAKAVPQIIADRSLRALEYRANALLSESGLSFTFAWDRETQTLEPVCESCGYTYKGKRDKECPACGTERGNKRSDELDILVDDLAAVEEVREKSGGAKVLVAASIRLAAGQMLRERRGSTWAVAHVDEPFATLDIENREALARTFVGMLGSVGLLQVFVVSHDTALLEALPTRVEITRDGNRSSLRVVI